MKHNSFKLDVFKKSLSITTKTLGKQKKTEIIYNNENRTFNGDFVSLKEPPKKITKLNISSIRG